MKRTNTLIVSLLSGVLLFVLCACGGGGGGGGGTVTLPPPPPLQLTITTSNLPVALQAHPYTATLTANGGVSPYKWSIVPFSGQPFPTGLSIDANTGVLSGTPDFTPSAAFTAQVSDSQGHSASKLFGIACNPPLSASTTNITVNEYSDLINGVGLNIVGGIGPETMKMVGGALPAGLHINFLNIAGSAFQLGTFSATMQITDSFSPPEVVTAQVNVTVVPAFMRIAASLPRRLPLNVPFSGRVVVRGGTAPYTFSVNVGGLPPGMSLDATTGAFTGAPTQAGFWGFGVLVTDSSVPAQTQSTIYQINTDAARGRNDTPATATPYTIAAPVASISPYIDPPNGAPTAADGDYYKIVSAAGLIVNLSTATGANPLLDTVLEIVDANGIRYATCRQPGDTTTVFNSACINDDESATPHITSSALDFKVPGTTGSTTTFFAHVIDFRGDARPDMIYEFFTNGASLPLSITTTSLKVADVGVGYFQGLGTSGGTGTNTWTVTAGALPPGLNLLPFGAINGDATTVGTFSFTLQVTDTSNPPQVASAQYTLSVSPAPAILSPATWPDACVNQPYSFAVQTSGGTPPVSFFLTALSFPLAINQTTGVVGGTPTTTGSFTNVLQVADAVGGVAQQNISLTVKTCP